MSYRGLTVNVVWTAGFPVSCDIRLVSQRLFRAVDIRKSSHISQWNSSELLRGLFVFGGFFRFISDSFNWECSVLTSFYRSQISCGTNMNKCPKNVHFDVQVFGVPPETAHCDVTSAAF